MKEARVVYCMPSMLTFLEKIDAVLEIDWCLARSVRKKGNAGIKSVDVNE